MIEKKYSDSEYELKRLDETLELIKEQIKQAKERNEKKKQEILEAKEEMRENSDHSIGNLWGSEAFEALAELSQFANPVMDKIVDFEEIEDRIRILEGLLDSPYFARVDFRFEEEDDFEEIYIGRSSLKNKTTHEIKVYDWRSPIASVFYRFVAGRAFYDAPAGRIEGEVGLKRQYEIAAGRLEYFLDADVQITDEFLKKMLSQNTSPKMKTIVETIQKEQDVIIRDMENDLMMVQGVAGSGKTSIALHRAAYLMYQGLTAKLAASNIMIISPNSLFEQYISDVLPELGESNVESLVFEDILAGLFHRGHIQSRNQFLERLVNGTRRSKQMKKSIQFKTSPKFQKMLELFVEELPYKGIRFQNIYFEGKCVVKKETLRAKVLGRAETPLGTKLKQLEGFVLEAIREAKGKRLKKFERVEIIEEIRKFTELNIFQQYRALFSDKEYFFALAEKSGIRDDIEDVFRYTSDNLGDSFWHYDDCPALAYLYLKIRGSDKYKNIKQVVIDEAQDYYPLQYEVFRRLFPNAKFTVLGDMNQTLEKLEDISLYETVASTLKKPKATLVTMDKSFRCTNEILNYSLKFIGQSAEIKSFNRAGEEPQILEGKEEGPYEDLLVEEISTCRKRGYRSIGLICKSEKNARGLYKRLKARIPVNLVRGGSSDELQGVFVIPVYMSKGLEFDAVLICDADRRNYCSEDDKKLLYIASTRALHRLNVFCEGEKSLLV